MDGKFTLSVHHTLHFMSILHVTTSFAKDSIDNEGDSIVLKSVSCMDLPCFLLSRKDSGLIPEIK